MYMRVQFKCLLLLTHCARVNTDAVYFACCTYSVAVGTHTASELRCPGTLIGTQLNKKNKFYKIIKNLTI